MEIKHLNHMLYTDLPIDELEGRLAIEELEDRLELGCWPQCGSYNDGHCNLKYCGFKTG